METRLIPQEVFLLERYSSPEYFGDLRDAFEACVKAAENALDAYMQKLPADYRSRPINQQPDVVWGETVIPNLAWALQGLNDGFIELTHGNPNALGAAGNVNTSFSSLVRDFTWDWMPQPLYSVFDEAMTLAWLYASNVSHTQQGSWRQGTLSTRYREDTRGPLNRPDQWPVYRLNPSVRVTTGDKVPVSGVYLPDTNNSCAEYLTKDWEALRAYVMTNPGNPDDRSYIRAPTVWTLVERAPESDHTSHQPTPAADSRANVPAGKPCPETGWWFSPAKPDSRSYFKQGDVFPDLGGDYGETFWQWAPEKPMPKL